MTSLSVILGVVFIFGLVALGTTQTVLEGKADGIELTAAATGNVVASVPQRDLNLCMNACMRNCVTQPGDEEPCLELCNSECGA